MKTSKYGFTLAEILITLSIIGVIASMTIPSLVQDVQDAQYRTAWKRTYADLSQATKMLISENAGSLKGVFADAIAMRDKYANKLNYNKSCTSSSSEGCWHKSGKWTALDGTLRTDFNIPGIILNNGQLMVFSFYDTACSTVHGTQPNVCGWFFIDTNGLKGPNTIGKDIFHGLFLKDRLLPAGSQKDSHYNRCEGSSGVLSGEGCAAKYLYQ